MPLHNIGYDVSLGVQCVALVLTCGTCYVRTGITLQVIALIGGILSFLCPALWIA